MPGIGSNIQVISSDPYYWRNHEDSQENPIS